MKKRRMIMKVRKSIVYSLLFTLCCNSVFDAYVAAGQDIAVEAVKAKKGKGKAKGKTKKTTKRKPTLGLAQEVGMLTTKTIGTKAPALAAQAPKAAGAVKTCMNNLAICGAIGGGLLLAIAGLGVLAYKYRDKIAGLLKGGKADEVAAVKVALAGNAERAGIDQAVEGVLGGGRGVEDATEDEFSEVIKAVQAKRIDLVEVIKPLAIQVEALWEKVKTKGLGEDGQEEAFATDAFVAMEGAGYNLLDLLAGQGGVDGTFGTYVETRFTAEKSADVTVVAGEYRAGGIDNVFSDEDIDGVFSQEGKIAILKGPTTVAQAFAAALADPSPALKEKIDAALKGHIDPVLGEYKAGGVESIFTEADVRGALKPEDVVALLKTGQTADGKTVADAFSVAVRAADLTAGSGLGKKIADALKFGDVAAGYTGATTPFTARDIANGISADNMMKILKGQTTIEAVFVEYLQDNPPIFEWHVDVAIGAQAYKDLGFSAEEITANLSAQEKLDILKGTKTVEQAFGTWLTNNPDQWEQAFDAVPELAKAVQDYRDAFHSDEIAKQLPVADRIAILKTGKTVAGKTITQAFDAYLQHHPDELLDAFKKSQADPLAAAADLYHSVITGDEIAAQVSFSDQLAIVKGDKTVDAAGYVTIFADFVDHAPITWWSGTFAQMEMAKKKVLFDVPRQQEGKSTFDTDATLGDWSSWDRTWTAMLSEEAKQMKLSDVPQADFQALQTGVGLTPELRKKYGGDRYMYEQEARELFKGWGLDDIEVDFYWNQDPDNLYQKMLAGDYYGKESSSSAITSLKLSALTFKRKFEAGGYDNEFTEFVGKNLGELADEPFLADEMEGLTGEANKYSDAFRKAFGETYGGDNFVRYILKKLSIRDRIAIAEKQKTVPEVFEKYLTDNPDVWFVQFMSDQRDMLGEAYSAFGKVVSKRNLARSVNIADRVRIVQGEATSGSYYVHTFFKHPELLTGTPGYTSAKLQTIFKAFLADPVVGPKIQGQMSDARSKLGLETPGDLLQYMDGKTAQSFAEAINQGQTNAAIDVLIARFTTRAPESWWTGTFAKKYEADVAGRVELFARATRVLIKDAMDKTLREYFVWDKSRTVDIKDEYLDKKLSEIPAADLQALMSGNLSEAQLQKYTETQTWRDEVKKLPGGDKLTGEELDQRAADLRSLWQKFEQAGYGDRAVFEAYLKFDQEILQSLAAEDGVDKTLERAEVYTVAKKKWEDLEWYEFEETLKFRDALLAEPKPSWVDDLPWSEADFIAYLQSDQYQEQDANSAHIWLASYRINFMSEATSALRGIRLDDREIDFYWFKNPEQYKRMLEGGYEGKALQLQSLVGRFKAQFEAGEFDDGYAKYLGSKYEQYTENIEDGWQWDAKKFAKFLGNDLDLVAQIREGRNFADGSPEKVKLVAAVKFKTYLWGVSSGQEAVYTTIKTFYADSKLSEDGFLELLRAYPEILREYLTDKATALRQVDIWVKLDKPTEEDLGGVPLDYLFGLAESSGKAPLNWPVEDFVKFYKDLPSDFFKTVYEGVGSPEDIASREGTIVGSFLDFAARVWQFTGGFSVPREEPVFNALALDQDQVWDFMKENYKSVYRDAGDPSGYNSDYRKLLDQSSLSLRVSKIVTDMQPMFKENLTNTLMTEAGLDDVQAGIFQTEGVQAGEFGLGSMGEFNSRLRKGEFYAKPDELSGKARSFKTDFATHPENYVDATVKYMFGQASTGKLRLTFNQMLEKLGAYNMVSEPPVVTADALERFKAAMGDNPIGGAAKFQQEAFRMLVTGKANSAQEGLNNLLSEAAYTVTFITLDQAEEFVGGLGYGTDRSEALTRAALEAYIGALKDLGRWKLDDVALEEYYIDAVVGGHIEFNQKAFEDLAANTNKKEIFDGNVVHAAAYMLMEFESKKQQISLDSLIQKLKGLGFEDSAIGQMKVGQLMQLIDGMIRDGHLSQDYWKDVSDGLLIGFEAQFSDAPLIDAGAAQVFNLMVTDAGKVQFLLYPDVDGAAAALVEKKTKKNGEWSGLVGDQLRDKLSTALTELYRYDTDAGKASNIDSAARSAGQRAEGARMIVELWKNMQRKEITTFDFDVEHLVDNFEDAAGRAGIAVDQGFKAAAQQVQDGLQRSLSGDHQRRIKDAFGEGIDRGFKELMNVSRELAQTMPREGEYMSEQAARAAEAAYLTEHVVPEEERGE